MFQCLPEDQIFLLFFSFFRGPLQMSIIHLFDSTFTNIWIFLLKKNIDVRISL